MIVRAIITDDKTAARVGGREFLFHQGVNILAGENGCGKSSLLSAIQHEVEHKDQRVCRLIRDDSVPVYYYFGEEASSKLPPNIAATDMSTVRESHGQRLQSYLRAIQTLDGEATAILDEPELALDYFAVEELGRGLATKTQLQTFIATHHPLLYTIRDANVINMSRNVSNYHQAVLARLRKRLAK